MQAYALATLHAARRMPLLGLLAGLGLAAVAVGLGLGIYALSSDPESDRRLAQESVAATAGLAALWVLARCLEQDAHSGFCTAADHSAAGVGARLVGRWVGAVLVGQVCALPALVASGAWTAAEPMYLLFASTCAAALLCAWALLASRWGGTGVVVWLGVGVLWLAGHLPWGAPGWGPGWGRGVAALLPPGLGPDGLPRPGTFAAIAGLVLLALALAWAQGARAGWRRASRAAPTAPPSSGHP